MHLITKIPLFALITCIATSYLANPCFAKAPKALQEISLKGDAPIFWADVGQWKLTWNTDKASVIAKSLKTKRDCPIYSVAEALPNVEFYRVIGRDVILVYGETAISELVLVDLDACKIKKYRPGVNTEITDFGYRSPVYCGDAAYPPPVTADNTAKCDSARVYKLDPSNLDFVIDENLSRSETLKKTGLEFFGSAKIKDPGKASQKLVQ
jgi:hypothetical protein